MDFLIIGNGIIGKKRIEALKKLKAGNIYLYDIILPQRIEEGIQIADENTFRDKSPDWVFIATPHYAAKDWVNVASQWGSHILLEKPMGRSYREAFDIYHSLKYPEQLYLGFNYRFYDGVVKLMRDIASERFGKIISVDMCLGHGGKPEDRTSWKLNPFEGSPDSLLDPGIHFLDLLNCMLPNEIVPLYGKSWRGFWKTGISEEINLMLDGGGFPITLNTSVVKWKNTFRIQVNGTNASGVVDGRGGFYGKQIYVVTDRWGWMKEKSSPAKIEVESDCENSFYDETQSLLMDRAYNCTAKQALDTMKLYDNCLKVIK